MVNIQFTLNSVEHTPGFDEVWNQYAEEMDANQWTTGGWPTRPYFSVFALSLDSEIISFIMTRPMYEPQTLYPYIENVPVCFVGGAWTAPKYRRLGLYSEVFDIMVNYYRTEGKLHWLLSGYHDNNLKSRTMQSKQGRQIIYQKNQRTQTQLNLQPTGQEFAMDSSILDRIRDKLMPLVDKQDHASIAAG